MAITKIEDMNLDNFPVTPENRAQFHRAADLLAQPEHHRLGFFSLAAPEGFHLKQALVQGFAGQDCLSITTDRFTEHLVQGIYAGTLPQVLDVYLEPRVLILDDIQVLRGKFSTQELLYRLLKERLEAKKLTVLFSALPMEFLATGMPDELAQLLTLALPEG